MSGLPAEGSVANPYRENPPTHFVEVHWVSGAASWPTKPFSYLERTGTTPLGDSYIGTASFWLRVNGTMAGENPGSPALGNSDGIPIVFVIGPRHLTEAGIDPGFYIRVRGDGDFFQVQVTVDRAIGGIRALIEPVNTNFGATYSLPGNLCDNKWTHFLTTWDFSTGAGSGTLTVNKVARTIYPRSLSFDLVTPANPIKSPSEIPAHVPWGQPARFFGAHTVLPVFPSTEPPQLAPAEPMLADYKLSLAHVWVSAAHKVVDVAQFVTEDRPATFGPAGEITVAGVKIKPDFYFSGGGGGFVANAGSGGATKLVGQPPILQTINPKIGT